VLKKLNPLKKSMYFYAIIQYRTDMKRYFSLLIFLVPLLSYAQPVMTYSSHGFKPATNSTMQVVEYVSPGDAGTQVIWDFKHALPTERATVIKESISLGDKHDIVVTDLQGVKFFFNCDRQGSVHHGCQTDTYTLVYDQPITRIIYPFTYGDKISGHFSGHIFYSDGSMNRTRIGTYSTEADAVGTMVLPNGQVLRNVLRLKTVENYVEKMCSTVEVEHVKYQWYVEEHRFPVFVIQDRTYTHQNGEIATFRQSFVTTANLHRAVDIPVYESETSVAAEVKQIEEVEHSVYPNPYSDILHITYTLNAPTTVNISLYSLSGTLVSEIIRGRAQSSGVQHITYVPKTGELTGTYYLRLQFGNKVYVRALVKN
jgi:hypothetical protein